MTAAVLDRAPAVAARPATRRASLARLTGLEIRKSLSTRSGRSLTLAPYAQAAGADGSTSRVSAEGLERARAEYAQEARSGGQDASAPALPDVGDSLVDRLPEVLRAGERRTAEIVAALPDYRRSSVLSTLSVLARQGRIVRVGHGVYALPDAG